MSVKGCLGTSDSSLLSCPVISASSRLLEYLAARLSTLVVSDSSLRNHPSSPGVTSGRRILTFFRRSDFPLGETHSSKNPNQRILSARDVNDVIQRHLSPKALRKVSRALCSYPYASVETAPHRP